MFSPIFLFRRSHKHKRFPSHIQIFSAHYGCPLFRCPALLTISRPLGIAPIPWTSSRWLFPFSIILHSWPYTGCWLGRIAGATGFSSQSLELEYWNPDIQKLGATLVILILITGVGATESTSTCCLDPRTWPECSFPVMRYLRCPNILHEIPPWFKLAKISFCCLQSEEP